MNMQSHRQQSMYTKSHTLPQHTESIIILVTPCYYLLHTSNGIATCSHLQEKTCAQGSHPNTQQNYHTHHRHIHTSPQNCFFFPFFLPSKYAPKLPTITTGMSGHGHRLGAGTHTHLVTTMGKISLWHAVFVLNSWN